jgi:hypothetical protein
MRIEDPPTAVVHESEMCKESGRTYYARSNSALPGVGERPKDSAGALVHDLAKVHGDGEQEYQKAHSRNASSFASVCKGPQSL